MAELSKGARSNSPSSFFLASLPDVLVLETVARRLHEIAGSTTVTSNEAQWLIRARDILEAVSTSIIHLSKEQDA